MGTPIFHFLFQWRETPFLQQHKQNLGVRGDTPDFLASYIQSFPRSWWLYLLNLSSLSISQIFCQHFLNHPRPLGVLWWALMWSTFLVGKCLQTCSPFCPLSNLLSQQSTRLIISFLYLKHWKGFLLSSVSSKLPTLSLPDTPSPSQGPSAPSPFCLELRPLPPQWLPHTEKSLPSDPNRTGCRSHASTFTFLSWHSSVVMTAMTCTWFVCVPVSCAQLQISFLRKRALWAPFQSPVGPHTGLAHCPWAVNMCRMDVMDSECWESSAQIMVVKASLSGDHSLAAQKPDFQSLRGSAGIFRLFS